MKFLSIILLFSGIALTYAITKHPGDTEHDPAVRRCAAHDECRPGWRCVGVVIGKCWQVDP